MSRYLSNFFRNLFREFGINIIKVLSSRRARGWREEDGPTVRIVVYIIIKNGG